MQTTGISADRNRTSGLGGAVSASRHLLAGFCGLLLTGMACAQGTTTESELRSIDAGRRQQEREEAQRLRLQPARLTSACNLP